MATRSSQFLRSIARWFVLPGSRFRWTKTILVSRGEDAPSRINTISAGSIVDIELGPDMILTKSASFPRAAEKELGAVVALFVKKSFPKADQLYVWRHSVASRSKTTCTVNILILKATTLARLNALAADRDLTVRKVSVSGEPNTAPFIDQSTLLNRPLRNWSAATAACVFACCAFLIWTEWQAHNVLQTRIQTLNAEKASAVQTALLTKQNEQAADDALAAIQSDLAISTKSLATLYNLTEISSLLMDEVWLTEYRAHNSNAELTGFSKIPVSEVIAKLQSSKVFSSVTLSAPVSMDRARGASRFQLMLKLSE